MTEQTLADVRPGDWVIQPGKGQWGYDRILLVTDVTDRWIKVRTSRRSAPDRRRHWFDRATGRDDQGAGTHIRPSTAEERKAWGV